MCRYLKLLYAVLIGLAIFFIIRLVIFTAYFDLFKDNSAWSIFLAIMHGIRFDLSIFLTIISPFIVLLLLPVNSQKFQKIIYWVMYFVYAVITIYLVIDVVYFVINSIL